MARLMGRLVSLIGAAAAAILAGAPAGAQIAASILPNARSVQLPSGQSATATVFATMINAGSAALANCRVELSGAPGVSLLYQRTLPQTNALTGSPNTPFAMAAGASQSLYLAFTSSVPFAGEAAPTFVCDGAAPASPLSGVNTAELTFSTAPVLDIIPIGLALPDLDGVIKVGTVGGIGYMALAAVNIGAAGPVRVEPRATTAPGRLFPGPLGICETNAAGQCLANPAPVLTVDFDSGQTRTFAAVVAAPSFAGIGFDPGATRLRVEFREAGPRRLAGVTSAAVQAPAPPEGAMSYEEAARLLVQATYGPTMPEIARVSQMGALAWINEQIATPSIDTHWGYITRGGPPGCSPCEAQFINATMESFWRQAAIGPDQLRQRMVFALSEIFVVSAVGVAALDGPEPHASYLDMLARNAFGNYRTLLEDVARHPAMGYYLSHIRNEREDPITGRIPDENFAREIMQLFSIGLWELNLDGSRRLDGQGQPIPTYGQSEISGMAKVFTGLSWAGPDTSEARWRGWIPAYPALPPWELPMQVYPQYHSQSEKRIISGVVIPPATSGDESLRIALDALHNHPNVGPFLGEQLIKRFVTSNPSRDYVRRVATVFNDNGQGVRGDMAAVIRAVLLDPEARDPAKLDDLQWGKLREPVVRFANWIRAFDATPSNGRYQIWNLEDPVQSLGQNPLRAPSVFNWFRPDYAPPGAIAEAGLVAPEFQITHETTATGYANFMYYSVPNGWDFGDWSMTPDYADEYGVAGTADALIARLNLLLMAGQMSPETQAVMRAAIDSVAYDDWQGPARRMVMGVHLALTAPDFVVQK